MPASAPVTALQNDYYATEEELITAYGDAMREEYQPILDLIFTIPAGAYSFEAANPRHEHEWRVLERIKLLGGKLLIPGTVTHSNVMIEHPETIADRIERCARVGGRENVIFGNELRLSIDRRQ